MTHGTEVSTRKAGEIQQANPIEGMMELAIREDRVDALERLVALKERMEDREARKAFFAALAAFREECPSPKRVATTQFTKDGNKKPIMYAPLEEIERVARPVATKHGLIWTWNTKIEGPLMEVTCRVLHIDGHSESATVSMPYESKSGASPQQKYGVSQTYGMRYSLIAALGLTTADEDTDGADPHARPDPVSAEQAAEIRQRMTKHIDRLSGMLDYIGVKEIEQIPADRYETVLGLIAKMDAGK